ncbi:hypothetical protein Hanom_Chr06g00500511 [Helianthus anomalus]
MVWQQLFWWMKVSTGSRFDSVATKYEWVGFFLMRGESYTCGVSISALKGMVLEKSEEIRGQKIHRFTRLLKK